MLYEITYYIQANYPQFIMVVVNYFEKTYLGSVTVDCEVRVRPKFPLAFWNHYSKTLEDPEFPRTSYMVEGFHRGFKSRVNRPRPTVQEYFRAIRSAGKAHLRPCTGEATANRGATSIRIRHAKGWSHNLPP